MTVRSPLPPGPRAAAAGIGLRRASTGELHSGGSTSPDDGPRLEKQGSAGQMRSNGQSLVRSGTGGTDAVRAEHETVRLRAIAARMAVQDGLPSSTYPDPTRDRTDQQDGPAGSNSFPSHMPISPGDDRTMRSPAEIDNMVSEPQDYDYPLLPSTHSDSPDSARPTQQYPHQQRTSHLPQQPVYGLPRYDSFASSGSPSIHGGDLSALSGIQHMGSAYPQTQVAGRGHPGIGSVYHSSPPTSPSMSMSFTGGQQGYYPGVWLPPVDDEGLGGSTSGRRGYTQQLPPSSGYHGHHGPLMHQGPERSYPGTFGPGQYGQQAYPSYNHEPPYGNGGIHGNYGHAFQSSPYHQTPDHMHGVQHNQRSPENPYIPSARQSAYSSPHNGYSPMMMQNAPLHQHDQHQPSWATPRQSQTNFSSPRDQYTPTLASLHGLPGGEWTPQNGYYGQGIHRQSGQHNDRRGQQGYGYAGSHGVIHNQQGQGCFRGAESSSAWRGGETRGPPGGRRARAEPGQPTQARKDDPTQLSVGLGIAGDPALSSNDPQELEQARAKLERKEYHPAPPLNRSDWVMWVGNVPGNASHEEMWKFFTAPMDTSDASSNDSPRTWLAVASIFLISRSSCAFVNFKSEEDLNMAISYFNGRTIRPWDPRCPPIVCRIRKTDDDLRAGVGGQRGAGLHTRYVKDLKERDLEKKERERAEEENTSGGGLEPDGGRSRPGKESMHIDLAAQKTDFKSVDSQPATPGGGYLPTSPSCSKSPPEGEGRRRESVQDYPGGITPAAFAAWAADRSVSGNHSFTSTNSSLLARHFPKRYFIMKSLNQEDLERSVKTGYWATQAHNEPILDQAFRTSPEVVLIFGANKQGSFFGYAIMRSAIKADTRQPRSVSQSSNVIAATPGGSVSGSGSSEGQHSRHSAQRAVLSTPSQPDIAEEGSPPEWGVRPPFVHAVSSELRLADASPREMTPGEEVTYPPPSYHQSASPMSAAKGASAPQPFVARQGSTPGYRPQTLDPKDLARIRQKIQVLEASKSSAEQFHLDPEGPMKAKREESTEAENKSTDTGGKAGADGVVRKDMVSDADMVKPEATPDVPTVRTGEALAANGKDAIGTPFKIQWIKVAPLPFHQIRHLRNPWNQDKEVKISRDGTEISPDIAPTLLAEWDKLTDSTPPVANAVSARRASRGPFDLSHLATVLGT